MDDIKGLKQLQRAFDRLGAVEGKKIVRTGMRNALKILQDAAIADAPKKTGKLRKSIVIRAMKRKVGRIGFNVIIKPKTKKPAKSAPKKGASANDAYWYGSAVEFGREGQQADPFLQRAADAEGDRVEREALEAISRGIMEAIGK